MGDAKNRGSFKDRQKRAVVQNAILAMVELERLADMPVPELLKHYYARQKLRCLNAIAEAKKFGLEDDVVKQFNQLKGKKHE